MFASSRARLSLLLLVCAAALGCASIEGQCQHVCEWEARCVSGSVSVEDCSSQCVNDNDTRSSDCQNAFQDFASCTAQNDQSCPGVDQQCSSKATRVIEKCDCTNPTGAMAELCKP
jgi:hypothetical protein